MSSPARTANEPEPTAGPTLAARHAAAVLAEHADQADQEGQPAPAAIQALRDAGLMGLLIPCRYGGRGASYRQLIQVADILAGGCPATAMLWAMHTQQVAVLVNHASDPQRAELLRRIADRQLYLASVTTEAGKGGHLLTAEAALLQQGESLVLDRCAPVVSGGRCADAFLITMRSSAAARTNQVSLVFADRDQLEIERISDWKALGMRATGSGGLWLRGRIEPNQLVASNDRFRRAAVQTMAPVGHIAWSAVWLGAARHAMRQVMGILRDPELRKGFPVHSDLFASRLAAVRLKLDAVAAFLNETATLYEHHLAAEDDGAALEAHPFQLQVNNLKVFASETLFTAVNELVQTVGLRYGYLPNRHTRLERTFRDLRSASLMYSNDRLNVANGKLCLLDREVQLSTAREPSAFP